MPERNFPFPRTPLRALFVSCRGPIPKECLGAIVDTTTGSVWPLYGDDAPKFLHGEKVWFASAVTKATVLTFECCFHGHGFVIVSKEIHTPGPTRSLNTPRRYRVCQRWVMIPDVCRSLAARCVVSFSIDVFVRPGQVQRAPVCDESHLDRLGRQARAAPPLSSRPSGLSSCWPHTITSCFKEHYASHCSSCTNFQPAFFSRLRMVVSFGYSPAIKRCRAL